ncbi:hypothetical protein EJ05DRAFT_505857 [Pseudovirgaria hyperparasitica]|uniref:Uncharacterized protein n=1 Tax=Pseudovirgaria hyperparasitica TaxID=470096 RepID=A0A6A6VR15_9PEZI|nr:uncharacterized protein EJ05DRAFT_505857 [Pseudovirgaria hyperparasitica]KAF2752643.1 hypothetical protein EJ05DRAFT_505857 [Pseudovirgaria hyperparasitica]
MLQQQCPVDQLLAISMNSSQDTIEDQTVYQDLIARSDQRKKAVDQNAAVEKTVYEEITPEAQPQAALHTEVFSGADTHSDKGSLIGTLERMATTVLVLSGKVDLSLDRAKEIDKNVRTLSRTVGMILEKLKKTDEVPTSLLNSRSGEVENKSNDGTNHETSAKSKRKADVLRDTSDTCKRQRRTLC